jgi:formamidopyrimidine-DNA glycosylase
LLFESNEETQLPELPEVETMRRGIRPAVGSRIESVERPRCSLRPILLQPRIDVLRRRLCGKEILGVGRRGKRVIVEVEGDEFLVIEPRMTGLVLLANPPDREHLRLRLHLSQGLCRQLLFWDRRGLGTVRLMRGDEITRLVDQKLGIDALQVTSEQLRQRLKHSHRAIKVALLDQSAVAGIGNLYAAEILFVAGVDPRALCARLTRAQWGRIHGATRSVLNAAIKHEGSTLRDGTYRNALNGKGAYQHFHRVYDRKNEICSR